MVEKGLKGNAWLNPEYRHIAPWAKKCAKTRLDRGAQKILLLVPASVGSNWFQRHCWEKSLVLLLNPRLTFVGHTHPYPKDLCLCVYGVAPGIDIWRWKS